MKLLTGETKKQSYKIFVILGLCIASGAVGYIYGSIDNTEDLSRVIIASKSNCIQTKNNIICVQN